MACEDSCDSQVGTYDWPCAFAGKEFAGFNIEVADLNRVLGTLEAVKVAFYTTPDFSGTPSLVLEDGSGITIVSDSEPWDIAIDDIASLSLTAGIYFYQMLLTEDAAGEWPYLQGKWRIKPSIA